MSENGIRVSVVIPTHDRREWVGRAVRSALARIGPRDEIIVVDDGSTDGTREAVASEFPGLRCLRRENGGPAAARNTGIRAARGEFVAFLDSDDEWLPAGLDEQVRVIANDPAVCASHGRVRRVRETGNLLPPRATPPANGEFVDHLLHRNFVTLSSVVVKRTALDRVGPFDERLGCSEDWDLWLRLAEKYEFRHLPLETAVYRFHPGQLIHDRLRLEEGRTRVLEKALVRARGQRSASARISKLLAYRLTRLGRQRLLGRDPAGARDAFLRAVRNRPASVLRALYYVLSATASAGTCATNRSRARPREG